MIKYLLTAIYILLTSSGIYLLKLGGNDGLVMSISGGLSFKMGYITLLGFICYLASFLLWQKLLVTYDLSYIVPLTAGIVQIIVLLVGAIVFKENVNWLSVIGVITVIAGITMMTYGKSN